MADTRFKPGIIPANKLPIPEKETLRLLYCDWRQTTTEIGIYFAVSGVTVGKWLKHHGIARRPSGTGLAQRAIKPPTDAELQDMIHVQHLSYREVAERYGVDQSAIQHWLDNRGIARPVNWYDRHNNPESLAELRALYNANWSLDQIAARDGMSRIQLIKLFKAHGVPLRKDGWHGKRFVTLDGNQVRSTYERTVANWLYGQGIEYTYEPALPFSNVWRADFLANGWYIEVWGVTNSPEYKARQAAKQSAYKANGTPLIDLPVHSFDGQRNELWRRILVRHLHHLSNA